MAATSATRTSTARTSAAHTSTTRTSTAHTSAARTSAAHTSAASTRRSFHKTTRFLRDTSRWRSAYQVVGSRAIDSNNIFPDFFGFFFWRDLPHRPAPGSKSERRRPTVGCAQESVARTVSSVRAFGVRRPRSEQMQAPARLRSVCRRNRLAAEFYASGSEGRTAGSTMSQVGPTGKRRLNHLCHKQPLRLLLVGQGIGDRE